MHSVIIIGGGLMLLGAFLLLAWGIVGAANASLVLAAQVFIPVWLLAALVNLWAGVSRAGYSVTEELPFFAAVFGAAASLAGASPAVAFASLAAAWTAFPISSTRRFAFPARRVASRRWRRTSSAGPPERGSGSSS